MQSSWVHLARFHSLKGVLQEMELQINLCIVVNSAKTDCNTAGFTTSTLSAACGNSLLSLPLIFVDRSSGQGD